VSSVKERQRNNIRVGIFVSVSILLGMAIVVALTDLTAALTQSRKPYTVSFQVASGVSNLKAGAQVRVGGLVMGQVTAVRPKTENGQFETILVDVDVDTAVPLYRDASVLLSTALLGSDAWLDCIHVGTPEAGQPGPGEAIEAMTTAGMLTSLVGASNAEVAEHFLATLDEQGLLAALLGPEGPAIIEELHSTVTNAESFSGMLDEQGLLWATLGTERADVADAIVSDLNQSLENARTITEDISSVTSNIRDDEWPRWSTNLNQIMDDGQAFMNETRALVNDNREGIDSIIANTESFTARVNTEYADKLSAFLDRSQEGLDEAVALIGRLQTDYEGWAVDLGQTMANASLTAQQLKLTSIEVRRSPWKLLYQPTPDELENELLYEATRSFALAAADVKAASDTVRRILADHGDRVGEDPELQERVTRTLLDPGIFLGSAHNGAVLNTIEIESLDDARVEVFRDVRDKDLRGRDKFFMAESEMVVRRLLRTPDRLHALFLSHHKHELMKTDLESLSDETPIYLADVDLMSEIAGFHIHRGVLAAGIRPSPHEVSLDRALGHLREVEQCTLLVAEGFTNVDNMGGLFRNAAAFGVDGILLDPSCCDPLYRKSIRVSMGHTLSVPYAISRSWPDDLLRLKHEWGVQVIGAEIDERSKPLWEMPKESNRALLFGSESNGLTSESLNLCDAICAIPMAEGVPSLNVAVAMAVFLYELNRNGT
jgi:tRNA G18 (ribose-2'-O)-methylase SpoU/ABC-type transporter Mla subunit MlaD